MNNIFRFKDVIRAGATTLSSGAVLELAVSPMGWYVHATWPDGYTKEIALSHEAVEVLRMALNGYHGPCEEAVVLPWYHHQARPDAARADGGPAQDSIQG